MTEKRWVEGGFFGIICRFCRVPMIVLGEHRSELTKEEGVVVEGLRRKYYSGSRVRGIGMRSLPGHWHEHYIGFKGE